MSTAREALTRTVGRGVTAGAHDHPAWWAYLVHRLSGLLLAVFLPLHFWALGTALAGPPSLDSFLRFAEQPLVRFAQWGLVVLLVVHLTGGVRLLLIEFKPWSGLRNDWIAGTVGVAAMLALAYGLMLFG